MGRGLAVLLFLALAGPSPRAARGDDPLPKSLRPGTRISIKGTFLPDGSFLAREIELRKEADDDQELRGVIDAVNPSARSFTILGFTVQAAVGTEFSREPDRAASFDELKPGLRVKVDGAAGADRTFQAEKVKIRENQNYRERRVVGPIDALLPAEAAGARLVVVGLDVWIDEATALVGIGGRARPIVRRRIGVVDDDDLLFTGQSRLSRRVAMAGEVRLRAARTINSDLGEGAADDELVPEMTGIVGFAVDLDSVFFFTEVAAAREFFVESDLFEEGEDDVRVGETYFELRQLGVPRVSLAIGRQKFNEEREWYYNSKNLDAARLLVDLSPLTIEASISRNLFDESRNQRDQDRTNLILFARYEQSDALELEAYYLDRDDRTDLEDSPRIVGLRLAGEPGRHVEYWADLARETGTRGAFDPTSGTIVVRDVRADALDAGLTYRPRIALDPSVTVSYAYGSGESEPDDTDGTFRQSGLQRNRGKYNGVVSFRYYGEVLDPELTNLRILTVAVGLRPTRALSFDVIFHRYRQDVADSSLRGVDIDANPTGSDPELGDALDLAVGFEPSRRVELRLTAGLFEPGDGFDPGLDRATVARLQAKFRF